MSFPKSRMRRLRTSAGMRRLVGETNICASNFVYPLFIKGQSGVKEPIQSLTDCFYYSPDMLADEIDEISKIGIPAVLLFGLPEKKDDKASGAYADDGIVQAAVRQIKKINSEMLVITDVCLCAYTDHGHCGVVKNGKIDNDQSVNLIARTSLSHADAGADIVAPSDMMDGRVGAIRQTLEENDHKDVAIMSYSAKYASAFYGPFRDAAESSPAFGDRRTYQMDCVNRRQAMREIEQDISEGADIVMVKPAMAYLDVIAEARGRFDVPIAAYNVSGEYMMIHAATKAGAIDLEKAMMESLIAIRRAGADIVITYFAKAAAKLLRGDRC